jgi:O-methyltransferase
MKLNKINKIINKYFFNYFNLQLTRKGIQHISKEKLDTIIKLYTGAIKQIEGYYSNYIDKNYKSDTFRTFLLSELQGTEISEALSIVTSLNNTWKVNGDICEFGVAQGRTSALICNEIIKSDKKVWFFDSFEGLSKPTEEDILINDISNFGNMEKYTGSMASPMTMLIKSVESVKFPKDRIKIIPGFIDKTLKNKNLPTKVSFAYVDFDFYEPIKLALNFLDTVLENDGIILIDDYDFFSAGAKTAVDEFYQKNTIKYEFIVPEKYMGHFAILKKLNK